MAAARIAACTTSARTALALADDPAPPDTLDVVRRQRQLLRRAAALCLDPIAEESDGGIDSASDVHSLGRSRSRGQTAATSALPARP
ncbi:uncharacterized protein LOC103629542 [Zea mays]|uniref:uncharacterized protein LOC103629542 n=1 Tax=Zea mays TaxID=4577 RepID=UPI000182B423|nr:uncharacterized protein LOC103629542 [Zea mays]|eukprot:XP_008648856.1 uncharacterized protein LOC103629542 [Zea mays]